MHLSLCTNICQKNGSWLLLEVVKIVQNQNIYVNQGPNFIINRNPSIFSTIKGLALLRLHVDRSMTLAELNLGWLGSSLVPTGKKSKFNLSSCLFYHSHHCFEDSNTLIGYCKALFLTFEVLNLCKTSQIQLEKFWHKLPAQWITSLNF